MSNESLKIKDFKYVGVIFPKDKIVVQFYVDGKVKTYELKEML